MGSMLEPKQAFLSEKALAVVGVSRKPGGFGKIAMRELRKKGYRVFPVNSRADEVEGERCFRDLLSLPEKVGAALIVVPPAETAKVVADCARAGIRKVWMQQGAESSEAVELCRASGIDAVHGACVLMYAQPTGFHRFHRALWKLFGKL